ncbi:unannotated protein [freshwater metagenome]|uniref:Unannotated protein n=1 Tax=freshwater metagenome TaxID=449393 RepID=A0A6J5ZCZ0_9ZZZZ
MTADLQDVVHFGDGVITRAFGKRIDDGFREIGNRVFAAQCGKGGIAFVPRPGPELDIGKINVFKFHNDS